MRKSLAAFVPVAVLALSACGSPEVVPDDDYEGVEDLLRAAETAGVECSDAYTTGRLTSQRIRCDEPVRLIVYTNGTAPEDPAEALSGKRESYLVSDTWVIGHDDPQVLENAHNTLGGELITISPLEAAVEECQPGTAIDFDPDYDVASISGAYRWDSRGATDAFDCLIDEIPVPGHVQSDIERTRALDGTRDASWDEYEASWTYHPDSGLNIQIIYSED